MAATRIDLQDPVADWFGSAVKTVWLRKPTARDHFLLGEPRFACLSNGASYWVEKEDTISAYVDRLLSLNESGKVVDGGANALLALMSLDDGIAVRDALFGFFTAARERLSKKLTSSSST